MKKRKTKILFICRRTALTTMPPSCPHTTSHTAGKTPDDQKEDPVHLSWHSADNHATFLPSHHITHHMDTPDQEDQDKILFICRRTALTTMPPSCPHTTSHTAGRLLTTTRTKTKILFICRRTALTTMPPSCPHTTSHTAGRLLTTTTSGIKDQFVVSAKIQ